MFLMQTRRLFRKHYGLALIKKLPFPVDLWRDAVLMADRLEADVVDPSAITEGQGMTELERVAKRREIVNDVSGI